MKKKIIIITAVLISMLLPGFPGIAIAHLWEPTLPIFPYEPTECDSVEVGIVINGCVTSITPTVSDDVITVTVLDADGCFATVPGGPYIIALGKLTPGTYQLNFMRYGKLMTGDHDVPYQRSFTVASADCNNAPSPTVLPTLTPQYGPNIKAPFAGVLTISGITLPGAGGTFWASFQWNPKKFSLELISHGQDPQYWY